MSRSYATQGAAMLLAVVVQGEELLRFLKAAVAAVLSWAFE